MFSEGARFSCKGMRVHVLRSALAGCRAVFVPVRSYRSAVARNRAKRLLRECWRLGKDRHGPGYDVAVVLFPGTDSLDQRRTQLERLLAQAGVLSA